MKNKIIIISIVILILFIGVFIGMYSNDELSFNTKENKKHVYSMMVEQTAGAGDYELSTGSSWPSDGYVLNSELSKCENGSKVEWNDVDKIVILKGDISDKCYIYFDKYTLIKINNYSIAASGNSIVVTMDATSGTGSISKYYYSIDNGKTFIESTDNTYTFSNLSTGIYDVKAYIVDSNNKSSSTVSKSIEITTIPFATYIKSLYTGVQGENSLYHHDGTLTNGIDDNSYRYAGASNAVNNYVCFGSDAESCPEDNLYRIIGVFGDQVKLIKATAAPSSLLGTDGDYKSGITYAWNYKQNTSINSGMGSNTWSTSLLNKTNLNTNYINNIGSTWASKIAKTTWKVGGNTYNNLVYVVPTTVYQNEIINPVTTNSTDSATEYSAKIGLMYVSDYYYAAAPDVWTKIGYSSSGSSYDYRSATGINWLYLGIYEWTITRGAQSNYYVARVLSDGRVSTCYAYYSGDSNSVRPAFYLNSSVTYESGDGFANSPYRIN